jgi:CHAT domain-containing protein/Flp pilus assembly protein TadD
MAFRYDRSTMRFASQTAFSFRPLLVVALSALAAGQSAQSSHLELGKTISGDLSEGQTHSYSMTLEANQYLRAVVTQPVAAAVVELYSPDGKKALELDTRNFANEPSRIVWVTETAGEYRIGVSGAGHYEIKLKELRAAGADDGKRLEAERSFMQGLGEGGKYAYDQAVLSFTRALGLYREVGDREREGDTLDAAGTAYDRFGQSDKAIGYYEQALAIRREVKDRQGEGTTLNNLGFEYFHLGQNEKAIGYYEQALSICREVRDRQGEGTTLNGMGNVYLFVGQYGKAIGYYEQALAIRREVKDREGEGSTSGNLGNAYRMLSQDEKAIGYYERSLALAREVKDRQGESRTLNNLGIAYRVLSQYEKAIGYYEQALRLSRELKDRRLESMALANLGNAYADLSQYEKAISYHEQALALAREVKERLDEGAILNNLGLAYMFLDQNEKAIGYYEQALAIAREVKDREGEEEALNNLGIAYMFLSQNEKAIGYYEQALALMRALKDRQGEGMTLENLGDVYHRLSQNEKAIGYYEQALTISREVKDRDTEALELDGLMDTWQASGKPRLAIFYGKQAVNTVQSMRSDIAGLGQDLQQSFRKGKEKPYHTLAEILIAQGRLAEAEEVLGLLKEEEYFQYIRREAGEASSLNRRADLTPEEAQYETRYREIGDRLMTIGVERGELLAKKTLTPEQTQRLDLIEHDLAAGNQAFEHFLGDLTQHFGAKPDMAGRVDTLRETQGIMEDLRELPAGTVAIFTLIGDDKFYAILRTPDAQKAYEYPIKGADLNAKISAFHQVIQDPNLDPRPLAEELYKILIAGMADDLRQANAKTLMWSLDGALRYVPLAALYDGKQYLIEQYRVSVMTLASNARLKDRPDQHWTAAGFGSTATLPSVASELAGIITTKPGDGGVLVGEIELDGQFTQQAMRQMLRKRYPAVHIASHFAFQPGNDANSFLLLGDGAHLTLAELKTSSNMFGGVQLLTLSACNTGMGDGAEVEGFGTLAQRQGAKAVVASLWPVADESTALLMREFYRIRETNSALTKLDALREAQLELLHGMTTGSATSRQRGLVHDPAGPATPQDFRHPYFWAPFFLMGNWL